MEYDLFSRVYKYTPKGEDANESLENFCTEIFAYILRSEIELAKKSTDNCISKILKLFGIEAADVIEIITQKQYDVEGQTAIPDIVICSNENGRKKYTIIEVKVDAPIGSRKLRGKDVDQLTFYNNIDELKNKEVCLLSRSLEKRAYSKFKNVFWFEIYSILKNKYESEVINNFLKFMEENKMCTYALKTGCGDIYESIQALETFLKDSFKNIEGYHISNKKINNNNIYFTIKKIINGDNSDDEDIAYFYLYERDTKTIEFEINCSQEELKEKAIQFKNEENKENKEAPKDFLKKQYSFVKLQLGDIYSMKEKISDNDEAYKKQIEEFRKMLDKENGINDLLTWFKNK